MRPRDAAPPPAQRSALPSGYLLAALAVLVVAPLAIAGWVAGAVAVRAGVPRARLAIGAATTGSLSLAILGPANVAAGLQASVLGLAAMLPWSFSGVLAAIGPLALRGIGLAWVTVPAGITLAALIRPLAGAGELRPEWQADERRRKMRADRRVRNRADRLADSRQAAESGALAVSYGGDGVWRRGRLIVPPANQLGLATLLVGSSGTGKTTAAERLANLAARERRHITVLDGKGTDGLDETIAAAVLDAWPDAVIRSFPNDPVDLWRGTPQQLANRLVAAWRFSDEAEFYEQAAMLGLRLAMTAPAGPCKSSRVLVERLDPAWLKRTWQGNPLELGLIRSMEKRLGDVALRAANLAAALGPAWDGDWWLDDVDVALFTIPTLENHKDADSAMRVLVAAYGQHITRPGYRRPSWLLFDEFSAVQGGRQQAISLVERSRSAGAGVALSAQSAAGLGDQADRERLLAGANAVLLFRTPMPAELAALAGSERVAEAAWQMDDEGLTGRSTVTERHRGRLDQDLVRSARVGEVAIIVGGRVERGKVIRNQASRESLCRRFRALVARVLTAPPIAGTLHPSTPGRAVATRVPAPPAPRQGQAATPSPPASLDPPPAARVRRHRPPGAGKDSSPGSDRDNQQDS